MSWFLVKIVYRIICGEGKHIPQFDEQLRLVEASDEESAFSIATELGRQGEDRFFNQSNQLVQWHFVNVSELFRIEALQNGVELYSRIEEKENGELYTALVHSKAEHLQLNHAPGYLQSI